MRAVVSSGKSKRVVDLPTWVEVRVISPTSQSARCLRCRALLDFYGPREEDERALGRFATWHRRCPDRTAIETAVAQAPIDRARAAERDAWFARRRGRVPST